MPFLRKDFLRKVITWVKSYFLCEASLLVKEENPCRRLGRLAPASALCSERGTVKEDFV